MSVDLPAVGSHVVELGGRSVHLLDQPGQGPPVVLLGGCAVPSYAFAEVIALLAGRRIVALDRPGLVQTPWPDALPTLEQEVSTLVDLLSGLGEPAVVVGHSMAGPHAEAVVRRRPDLVRGLILLDGSVEFDLRRPGSGVGWLAVARAVRQATGLAPLAGLGAAGARVLFSVQSARRRLTDARPERARQLFRRPDTLAMIVAEQAAYGAQLWDLARLRCDEDLAGYGDAGPDRRRGRWGAVGGHPSPAGLAPRGQPGRDRARPASADDRPPRPRGRRRDRAVRPAAAEPSS